MIKVSVILPTYNRAHTLKRAIDSVLNQGFQDLEVIVVDDGSTDDSESVVASLKDKRIKYLKLTEKKGPSAARNFGLRFISGDFVAFLDSDDEWLPQKTDIQLKFFKNVQPGAGLVFTNGYEPTRGEGLLCIDNPGPSRLVYGSKERDANIFPGRVNITPPSCWMLPRKVVEEIGLFDESIANWEDCDYFARIARKHDVYFINTALFKRYRGPDSLDVVSAGLQSAKEVYLKKYLPLMEKDRKYLFKFYKTMAKDYAKIGDKKKSSDFLFKALKINPLAINIFFKLLSKT